MNQWADVLFVFWYVQGAIGAMAMVHYTLRSEGRRWALPKAVFAGLLWFAVFIFALTRAAVILESLSSREISRKEGENGRG